MSEQSFTNTTETYIVIEIAIPNTQRTPYTDILTAELTVLQYEGFEETAIGLKAYIPENQYDAKAVEVLLQRYKAQVPVQLLATETIEQQNWNQVWESNFPPMKLGNQVIVKAPFHEVTEHFDHEIIISPEMAFGTGHHETTSLMLAKMLDMRAHFPEKKVLDFGCGTGILAIMASLLQAKEVMAIDYDPWSYENTLKNIHLNQLTNIQTILGSQEQIPKDAHFDIILANINRNVILQSFDALVAALKQQLTTYLLLSGILQKDIPAIEDKANTHNLKCVDTLVKNNWTVLVLQKSFLAV